MTAKQLKNGSDHLANSRGLRISRFDFSPPLQESLASKVLDEKLHFSANFFFSYGFCGKEADNNLLCGRPNLFKFQSVEIEFV